MVKIMTEGGMPITSDAIGWGSQSRDSGTHESVTVPPRNRDEIDARGKQLIAHPIMLHLGGNNGA
jgi:hypothetical protein